MLFAIQHDMVDDSIVDVINAIDRVRGIIPRADEFILNLCSQTLCMNIPSTRCIILIYDKHSIIDSS